MALDGLLLHNLQKQFQACCPMKINKLAQVSETELLLHLRSGNQNYKMTISTHTQYNRINFTQETIQSPLNANNFLMVLRKYIDNGYITQCQQVGLDRILDFTIVAYDDLRDEHTYHLFIELMGKYANVVLVNEENKIIDAMKRIPPFENNKRSIFPGLSFTYPDVQNKKDPFSNFEVDEEISLTKQFHGFSPLLSTEVLYRIKKGQSFEEIMQLIDTSDTLYLNETENQFHCIELTHLEGKVSTYPLMKGFDVVYFHQQEKERIREQSGDLYKVVKKELAKNKQKLPKLQETLDKAMDCEQYRYYGDLLFAYSYQIQGKVNVAECPDFETNEIVRIPMNIKFDAKTNAKKYYQKYHKAKTAQIEVQKQIEICEKEIEYFILLESQLAYANLMDATEIRNELEKLGYLKKAKQQRTSKKQSSVPHFTTLQLEDATIHIGKNNIQNDYLTFHFAKKDDLWFHAKDYHGAHIILQTQQPTEYLIRTCAMIAAFYSQGKASSSVPVNYTPIKTLKKAKGKAVGQALLSTYKTIYIDPDEKTVVETIDTYKKKKS